MLLEVQRSLAITLFLTSVSRFCRIQLAVTIDSKQPFEHGLEITPKITVNLVYVAQQRPASLLSRSGYRRPLVQKASVRSKDGKAAGFGRTDLARCATTIGQRFLISPEQSDVKKPHLTEENERAWRATTHRAAAMSRRFERFDIRFS